MVLFNLHNLTELQVATLSASTLGPALYTHGSLGAQRPAAEGIMLPISQGHPEPLGGTATRPQLHGPRSVPEPDSQAAL